MLLHTFAYEMLGVFGRQDAAVHCLEGFAEEAERLRVEFTANCATDDSV